MKRTKPCSPASPSSAAFVLAVAALLGMGLLGRPASVSGEPPSKTSTTPRIHGICLGMTPDAVLHVLGHPEEQSPDPGHPWWMHYQHVDLCFNPITPAVEWIGASDLDFRGHLTRGMPEADVRQLLGKPQQSGQSGSTDPWVSYELGRTVILIHFHAHRLSDVSLQNCPPTSKHCTPE